MILERIVAIQIEEFFEENNLFASCQFGFRKNKNTISELLTVFDNLIEAKEMKKEILILLYDLSAAFDTVSHDMLLTKLKMYGFDSVALKWMKSYLTERKQMVTVSGKLSSASVSFHMFLRPSGMPAGTARSSLCAAINCWRLVRASILLVPLQRHTSLTRLASNQHRRQT